MNHISAHDYESFHESAESLRDDRDIHPRLRRRCISQETDRCRACGQRFLVAGLTDDPLCEECNAAVEELEKGKI